ncbi:MAG: hypothetical protein AB7E95_14335, partial [Kiritimatiellales bacterium]
MRVTQIAKTVWVGFLTAMTLASYSAENRLPALGNASGDLRTQILQMRPPPLTNLDVNVRLNVRDFGAFPNDGKDDRAAVGAAIEKAKSLDGPVQLDFEPGRYDFFAVSPELIKGRTEAAILLQQCENLIIDGHGAEGVIHRQDVFFVQIRQSTNLIVRNFTIDYDPLPFSQGTVEQVNRADSSFMFRLHPGFPPPDDLFFRSCSSWGMLKDTQHPGRLKAACPAHFFYKEILSMSNGLFRVVLGTPAEVAPAAPGDVFVINGRSASIGHCLNSENITFDRLTIHACPSALFIGLQTSQLNILNCKALLKGNRLITAGADGVHCQSARIGPWIENCEFEGLSDDCLNIYGLPIYVLEQVSPTQLTVHARAAVRPGDRLAFFNPNEGRIILETTVASFSGSTLMLNDPLNETLNLAPPETPVDDRGWKTYDHAYNLDTIGNHFVYRNNYMHDGRRYGLLLKASYGLVENNVFEGLSLKGMVLENNIGWPEGFW